MSCFERGHIQYNFAEFVSDIKSRLKYIASKVLRFLSCTQIQFGMGHCIHYFLSGNSGQRMLVQTKLVFDLFCKKNCVEITNKSKIL